MKLTEKQKEIIARNLRAFEVNFGEVKIERLTYGNGFNVYYPADTEGSNYIQHCESLDYLNGWLYGCVQGVLRKELRDGYLGLSGAEKER